MYWYVQKNSRYNTDGGNDSLVSFHSAASTLNSLIVQVCINKNTSIGQMRRGYGHFIQVNYHLGTRFGHL